MLFNPKCLTCRIILPVVLTIALSLGLVFLLLSRQVNDATIRLNTAYLAQKSRNLLFFCEKAAADLTTSDTAGKSEPVAVQKKEALREIRNFLASEDLNGMVTENGRSIFSTVQNGAIPPDGMEGPVEIKTTSGRYHGYSLHFPAWGWRLTTLLHERVYWQTKREAYSFMVVTGGIYLLLLLIVYLILRFNLQRPLSIILRELNQNGQVTHRTQIEEIDTLSSAINDALIRQDYVHAELARAELEKRTFEYKAMTDGLTGLYNRRKFNEILELEIEKATRYHQVPLSLIMFDLDHFKSINDTYGHHAGDEVLTEFGKVVSGIIRRHDTVARWGGEEFIILTPNSPLEQTRQLAERIRSTVENYRFGEVDSVTASMGVTQFIPGESAEDFTSRADSALYKAKQMGRNRVEMCERAPRQLDLPKQQTAAG